MARQRRSLTGKTVVITGGARGIGAATAAALARRGAKVAIGDRDLDAAEQTAHDIGGETIALPLDVTDRTRFTAFLDQVESQLGPLDVLINNAGIMPLGRIEDEADTTTAHQLAINLHAVIHGSREAVVRMKPRHAGHIVNVASAAGRIPLPGGATYTATKHGVVGFCEAIRAELRGTGIDVTCVLPGMVATELAAGLTEHSMVKPISADKVAEAIVRALVRPRFEVFVPATIGPSIRLGVLAGRRFGDWVQRALGTDTLMIEAAVSPERREYQDRVNP